MDLETVAEAADVSTEQILEYLELMLRANEALYSELNMIRIFLALIIVCGVCKFLYTIFYGWFFGGA